MEIKKYNPQEKSIVSFMKSEQEMRMSSNDGEKGTEDNPYLLGEYIDLYLKGQWTGGYVEGIGYVGKDQGNVSFPSSSEYDWEEYFSKLEEHFSSVFSFLSRSQAFPSGISIPSASKSKGDNAGKDYRPRTEYRSIMMDGIHFDFRFLISYEWAIASCCATSSREILDHEFFLYGRDWNVDLDVYNESRDGQYRKYTFQRFSFPYPYYMERNAVVLCSHYSGESIRILD